VAATAIKPLSLNTAPQNLTTITNVYKRNVISPDRRERAYHNYTNDLLNRRSTRTDALGEETLRVCSLAP
jgi:hypothetical protein